MMRGTIVAALALAAAIPVVAQEAPTDEGDAAGSGLASYYGRELAGNRTASGERFNPDEFTAAHRTIPFGARVLVTHLASGRSTIVRVNDRGPWRGPRIIDISQAAARAIGLDRAGVGKVSLKLLRR